MHNQTVTQTKQKASKAAANNVPANGLSRPSMPPIQSVVQLLRPVSRLFGISNSKKFGTETYKQVEELERFTQLLDSSTNHQELGFVKDYIVERARKTISGKPWPDNSEYDRLTIIATTDEDTNRIIKITMEADNGGAIILFNA